MMDGDQVERVNPSRDPDPSRLEAGDSFPLTPIPPARNGASASEQFLLPESHSDRGYAHIPKTKQEAAASLLQTLYRSLRVSLVKNLIASRWDTNLGERSKVAIHKNRLHAILRCVTHLVPVTAAIALVTLNLSEYYVGGELAGPTGHDDEKLGALQFAAKLHELLMIASLATVVFTYIRRELVFGEGVPYGALSAGLEIDKVSFLYSPELWSAIWAEWERKHKKWVLIALLVTCTLLGVSVGPSTANLMRPRLDYWPAGGTDYWIDATQDELQPLQMEFDPTLSHCKLDTGDPACPYGDWQLIEGQYHAYWGALKPMGSMPETVVLRSPLSSRSMVVRHRSTEHSDTRSIWQNAYSSATAQHSITADAISETGRLWAYAAANTDLRQQFMFRREAMYSTTAPQPVTQARCTEQIVDSNLMEDLKIQFPVLKKPECRGDSSNCFADIEEQTTCNNSTFVESVKDLMRTGTQPTITWVDGSICSTQGNSSISAVAAFPQTNLGGSRIYFCTIDGRSANTTISGTRNYPKVVTGYPQEFLSLGTYDPAWPRTVISADWASLLFPGIPGQNATVFSITASTAGIWNSTSPSEPYNYPFIVESILAASITNGIARSTYNNTIVGRLKGISADDNGAWDKGTWVEEILPKHSLGWGGSIYTLSAAEAANSTRLVMHATVLGYAWSYTGMLQKANIAVLLVYSTFALAHFAYSGVTGWTSTAWDTSPEIIALAMNSSHTEKLRNTGAGIDTVDPFKQKVRVRCVGYHLEYVFEDNDDVVKQVKPNRWYS